MCHNNNVVVGSDLTAIEPNDTILLYLSATSEAIMQSITLLALLKRKQQPLLLVTDKKNRELIVPILKSFRSQLLNYFYTDTPRKTSNEIIGIFLQSGLLDLV